MADSKDKQIKEAFRKIKDEMTDHLEAINANTEEINANYSYSQELEKMITKLKERIDDLETKLNEKITVKTNEELRKIKLSPKEKEVFLMLYEEKGELLDYKKIARNLGLTSEIIRRIVSGIIDKGIPIVKKEFDGHVYLMIDSDFRNLQAKENLISFQ